MERRSVSGVLRWKRGGGLGSLRSFLPSDSNLAFVVVVHLSPEHDSHLSDLLQRHVNVRVEQVTNTVSIETNHVYVIPPNANLSAIDTHLLLRRDRACYFHASTELYGRDSTARGEYRDFSTLFRVLDYPESAVQAAENSARRPSTRFPQPE